MLNRPPTNTTNTLNAYRKRRQQRGPFLMYGAIALVVIGFILLVVWLTRPNQPLGQLFATDTPTATLTYTPTNTATPTETATITVTPTITVTSTPSGPTDYIIQEGDSLGAIAQKFNLGPDGILLILDQNPQIMRDNKGVIYVGDKITVPPPGTTRATSTTIPANLPRGTKLDYQVLPGDTLAGIAAKFNSKQEDIMTANPELGTDPNALTVGQTLKIPVNLMTATATLPASSTPVRTASCTFEENAEFVTQLQQLINGERTKAGLPALSANAQLTAAAKAQATYLLCNNYLTHTGLNGSTPESRAKDAGFNGSSIVEDLYALHPALGGNPQSAVNWWMSDATSKADLLNPNTTVFGIAYVSSDKSLLGGYFVVVSGKT